MAMYRHGTYRYALYRYATFWVPPIAVTYLYAAYPWPWSPTSQYVMTPSRHVFHCHITLITISDGTIISPIPLPSLIYTEHARPLVTNSSSLASTSRHAFHCHITLITIRDGTITLRIPLKSLIYNEHARPLVTNSSAEDRSDLGETAAAIRSTLECSFLHILISR
jgi:hypothetical protein